MASHSETDSCTNSEDEEFIREVCKIIKIKPSIPTIPPSPSLLSSTTENLTLESLVDIVVDGVGIVIPENTEVLSEDHVVAEFVVDKPIDQPIVEKSVLDVVDTSKVPERKKIIILEDITLPPQSAISFGDHSTNRKRQNKANKNIKTWQRQLNMKLREEGKSYLGYRRDRKVTKENKEFKVLHDSIKPAKKMGPPCVSKLCAKSKLKGCVALTYEERHSLFNDFWSIMNWEQRRQFVCSNISVAPCKRKVTESSRKEESKAYYLPISRNASIVKVQVCRTSFIHTLGLSEWFIRYWLNKVKETNGIAPKAEVSLRRRCSPRKKLEAEQLAQFFEKLPKLPSHYCRQNSSKLYLEPTVRNISELYEIYKKDCSDNNVPFLSRHSFDNEFFKSNLSLYRPKKDQCDICCSHNVGQVTEEVWNDHILNKNRARTEKVIDKSLAVEGSVYVLTQDVQAVKMAPTLQASALYFKTKLCVHNFTTYNLATHDVRCYWFDESNAGLEASVYASCIVDNIQHLLQENKKPVIIYSDGCCAQNRNIYLSNALLRVAMEHDTEITQKFLVKGHTQMECDSVHSCIEAKLKGQDIYLPSSYCTITKSARSNPKPYEAIYLDHEFFTNYSQPENLIYKSIRPGRKPGDPTVTDISVLVHKPNGTLWYKINFDDDLQLLPQRPKLPNTNKPLPKLYNSRLPIAERKWQHLQELKAVIPKDCHEYYNNLPH